LKGIKCKVTKGLWIWKNEIKFLDSFILKSFLTIKTTKIMKKVRVLFLGMALLAFVFNIPISLADCPTTNCGSDCGSGQTCSITQYENGQLCSWTICYGVGPSIDA
jgi:hypothetical protein